MELDQLFCCTSNNIMNIANMYLDTSPIDPPHTPNGVTDTCPTQYNDTNEGWNFQ